jgi:hypothetical protein
MPTELKVVENNVRPVPRKLSLYSVLEEKLRCADYDYGLEYLEMISASSIPKRNRQNLLDAVIEYYLEEDDPSSDFKEAINEAVASLRGAKYVDELRGNSSFDSRTYVLLTQLIADRIPGHHD